MTQDPSPVEGWNAFVETLRTLPHRLLDRLPAAARDDPQTRQEVGRLALEAIVSSGLSALSGDGDHPEFTTQIGQALNVGQPNADTIYRVARVHGDGVYRLRGRPGSLRLFNVSQAPPSPAEPGFRPEGGLRTVHDFASLTVDADGFYDVILSPLRPEGHDGDWWKLEPTTNKLLMRMVSSDWGREESPTVSIERIDRPARRLRPSAGELEARLRQLPAAIDFIAPLFVGHVERLRAEGYVNRLKVLDVTKGGGLAGQFYYEGAFELAEDEALVLQCRVPAGCRYRSLILTNDIYETLDWTNNQSSLNDAQSEPDADGVLRVVVSGRDPGVANWLDTAGHGRGLIQGRWVGGEETPIPQLDVVPLSGVLAALPEETRTVTPEAREAIVRARRAAFQQRPLW